MAIFLTPLRIIVVPLMPLFLFLKSSVLKGHVTSQVRILAWLYVLVAMWGVIIGTVNMPNALLAIWITVPLLLMQFVQIKYQLSFSKFNRYVTFYKYFLAIINIIGALYYAFIAHGGDEFGFAYGRHFQYVSGLAVMNVVMILYYLTLFFETKLTRMCDLLWFAFFSVCFLFCFFGLGLLCLILTVMVYFCLKAKIKSLAYGGIVVFLFIAVLFNSGTNIIEYNNRNIELTANTIKNPTYYGENARKILMFINYGKLCEENPIVAFVGVGGGGFNSRTALMLSNDADNVFTEVFGHQMPTYYKKYIYPLWNSKLVSYDEYTDGTRNKPFSSLLAFLAEGGLIFFILYCWNWIKRIKQYYRNSHTCYIFTFLFLLNLFWLFSMASEVWFESSEFLFFIIINGICVAYGNSLRPKNSI